MNPDAMRPHGLALQAYFRGETGATLLIRRDDGLEMPLPVGHFFRSPKEFSAIEIAALRLCRGTVLDIGAGSGLHGLYLQAAGLTVTAIDISTEAVDIMRRRGVRDVRKADVFEFQGGPFETLLMLGHGIGMVGDLWGLHRFLRHARGLVTADGQLLVDSLDVRRSRDPVHLDYHARNRQAGRYLGETRLQFEYGGQRGVPCRWLHLDPDTLSEQAGETGWSCEILVAQEAGDYLARLTPHAGGRGTR